MLVLLYLLTFNEGFKYLFFEGNESNLTDILEFISKLTKNETLRIVKKGIC